MSEITKTITIHDLRTFIEAVEFASDSDEWIPTARQWKRIREMIDQVVDTPRQINRKESPPAPLTSSGGVVFDLPEAPATLSRRQYEPPPPLNYSQPQTQRMAVPAGPSSLGHPLQMQQMTDTIRGFDAVGNIGANERVNTPDIDTSNGSYKTPYA